MPSGGGDAAPPARRPCGAALPGPQPSPALGASFLSGFLREPEPEEAAAGLSVTTAGGDSTGIQCVEAMDADEYAIYSQGEEV